MCFCRFRKHREQDAGSGLDRKRGIGEQHATALAQSPAVRGQVLCIDRGASPGTTPHAFGGLRFAGGLLKRRFEGQQAIDARLPSGERAVGVDEPRQRALHLAKGVCDLVSPPSVIAPEKKPRRCDHEGKHDCDLGVAAVK